MDVLKTTSPVELPSAPIAVPLNILPSANASTANPATFSPFSPTVYLSKRIKKKRNEEIFTPLLLQILQNSCVSAFNILSWYFMKISSHLSTNALRKSK
jgi:hypothetical protein